MVIDVHWFDEEKTIIYHRLIPPWSWEDYFQFVHQANEMMDTVPHMVTILTDARDIHQIPPHLFLSLQRLASMAHPRSGRIIVIHQNKLFNTIYGVLKRTGHPLASRYILAESVDAAMEQLNALQGA